MHALSLHMKIFKIRDKTGIFYVSDILKQILWLIWKNGVFLTHAHSTFKFELEEYNFCLHVGMLS